MIELLWPAGSAWLALHLLCSALLWASALLLHRQLAIAHAERNYWLGALALALLPAAAAVLLDRWLTLPIALPAELQLGELGLAAATGPAALAAPQSQALALGPILWLLYLGGLTALVGRRLFGEWKLRRVLGAAQPLTLDQQQYPQCQALLDTLAQRSLRVEQVAAAVSPFALAWPRARIVLPTELLGVLTDSQLRLVLRHELAHLRQRDPFWQALLWLLSTLCWFNPFVRALAQRAQLASELHCDRYALRARKNMRRAYAEAYLQTLRMSVARALPCPATAFSTQDQGHHKMRIQHILHGDPQARKRTARKPTLTALAMLGAIALTAAHAAGNAPATPTELGKAGGAETAAPLLSGPIIDGRISSHYGATRPQISAEAHRGVDLVAARGTAVRAPAAGVVVSAEVVFSRAPNYGTVVVLDHGQGWQTLYAHLDRFLVEPGQQLATGETLGEVGSTGKATGPHVHVEVHHQGQRVDPAQVIARLVDNAALEPLAR